MEKESRLQEKAMRKIREYGGYVYKNAQNIYTEKGRPDLTACIPVKIDKLRDLIKDDEIGIFVGIELKRNGHLNEVSTAQNIVGNKIKKSKGLWIATDDINVVEALMIKLTGEK